MYGGYITRDLGKVNSYADVGGCFGFSANSMAFHIAQFQGDYSETKVFEISDDFINIGKQLFPYIDFIQQDFCSWNGSPQVFDLVSMFDVIEHVVNPERFLSEGLAMHAKYALLKKPLETTGEWRGSLLPDKQGINHPDGHIHFFTPQSYFDLLKKSGLQILDGQLIYSIVRPVTRRLLEPEVWHRTSCPTIKSKISALLFILMEHRIIPFKLFRKYFGSGDYLCLVKSTKIK